MPLRDHFRPPVEAVHSWDELHGMWPAVIVQYLARVLPDGYVAAPRVHLGAAFEIDVSTFEQESPMGGAVTTESLGGAALATWVPPHPTLTLETEFPDQDEYEVRVYDLRRGRRLVAAIELVSPSNKDRPESRRAFVAKAAALIQQDVCVSIVDIVTIRQFNLYEDLLNLIGGSDPMLGEAPPGTYVVTVRGRRPKGRRERALLDSWFSPVGPGQTLPTLPVWLSDDLGVFLDLEATYEESCAALRIR